LFVPAVANQLDKIAVPEVAKDEDLGHEFLHPLLGLW
jgi:hypothetical protein